MSMYSERHRISDLYLDLLKRTLSGIIAEDPAMSVAWRPVSVYDPRRRWGGKDWPTKAHTMIGMERLNNLQFCVETVIDDNIPGDLIETGVWRGGACIFMRGILKTYDITDRTVWVADSFCGFPPNQKRIDDDELASQPDQVILAVSEAEVVRNFMLYNLHDYQVRFIKGFFNESLPGPVKQLAVLRLDGDLYSSTMDSLSALYPLLEPGGFCIVDDWSIDMCKEAVKDYRREHGIRNRIRDIDGLGVYWRKE